MRKGTTVNLILFSRELAIHMHVFQPITYSNTCIMHISKKDGEATHMTFSKTDPHPCP